MGKVWVLDTETKGTGANVVPLETVQREPEPVQRPAKRQRRRAGEPRMPRKRRGEPERTATALPPGHVRKKSTGELGKVLAIDPRAGTATVRWLKSGSSSTVPLSSVARR
jgi:hypothetical protein